ncbi:MAG: hypothetical protein GC151_05010 [Betaproteobacteria bacterium]|nr:hypothetical protein [Betaproteobacteria bacterium]
MKALNALFWLAVTIGAGAPAAVLGAAPDPGASNAAAAYYMGYTGTTWAHDYGITRGRCDRQGVAAGLAAPTAATPGGSPVAVLAGLDVDSVDRACVAHALELSRSHRTIRWTGAKGRYSLTTGQDTVVKGMPCRLFILRTSHRRILGTACHTGRGVWEMVGRS